MPRPARHDRLPRLTGLIDWESLGSMSNEADADLASTANEYGLPILGTDSLLLPHGVPDTIRESGPFQDSLELQTYVNAFPEHSGAALEYGSVRYMENTSNKSSRGPLHDESMSSRMQQCLHTLHSVGFASVDSFALEYYTALLGSSAEASSMGQPIGSSDLSHLVMVLQNASTRTGTVEAAGLHDGSTKTARDIYISELRTMDHTSYNPEKAEHQLPHIYLLLHDLLTQVGCRPNIIDTTIRASIQGLFKSSLL
ncbi:hypothetical protein PENCOP_c002G00602 [Penicillium coprophilum]|uniref:Uncharacterized protein n=1 Tax=Penicillium coprophilum TaxID=36646 RepID=A0A1V6V338_9EURO|nr:hypothetical protein PENCOP_c002G00602 [Penicillium coprophilum]